MWRSRLWHWGDRYLIVEVAVCVVTVIKLGLILESCLGTVLDLCPGAVWKLGYFCQKAKGLLVPGDVLCVHIGD